MSRVLVCGGRDYYDHVRVSAVLDAYHKANGIGLIIHGASSGADQCANSWACDRGVPTEAYEADWEHQGSFAGPMRNTVMLKKGQPDLVIAFPGGKGTEDMKRKAKRAGVTVVEIAP